MCLYNTQVCGIKQPSMSKRARHAQTGRFVKRETGVGHAWPELGGILQEALPAHVFTGDVFDGGLLLRFHRAQDVQLYWR